METKEKAKQLIEKFTITHTLFLGNTLKNAKHCALICVDEMEKAALNVLDITEISFQDSIRINESIRLYFDNVRKEIENYV